MELKDTHTCNAHAPVMCVASSAVCAAGLSESASIVLPDRSVRQKWLFFSLSVCVWRVTVTTHGPFHVRDALQHTPHTADTHSGTSFFPSPLSPFLFPLSLFPFPPFPLSPFPPFHLSPFPLSPFPLAPLFSPLFPPLFPPSSPLPPFLFLSPPFSPFLPLSFLSSLSSLSPFFFYFFFFSSF